MPDPGRGWDGPALPELFASEDVTKDARLVHAWGPEKAVEYLRRLAEACPKVPQRCCDYDHDRKGSCIIHSAPGILRTRRF